MSENKAPICKACNTSAKMIYHKDKDEWVCHGTHAISESELKKLDKSTKMINNNTMT